MQPVSQHDVYDLLREVAIFKSIPDWRLYEIAAQFRQRVMRSKQRVFVQGHLPKAVYIVFEGRVEVYRETPADGDNYEEEHVAYMSDGDYFGEQAVLEDGYRTGSARTVRPTRLLIMPVDEFLALMDEFPDVEAAILLVHETRLLLRKSRFRDWVTSDETVLLIATKHWFWLAQRWFTPAMLLLALAFAAFMIWWFFYLVVWLLFLPAAGLVLIWMLVFYIDWRDDVYVVTDRRIISSERSMMVHQLSAESPLWAINAVTLSQGAVEKFFGYGDVIMQTITGAVTFNDINAPEITSTFISEQITRAKVKRQREEKTEFHGTLRRYLGWDKEERKPPVKPDDNEEKDKDEDEYRLRLTDLISLRVQHGSTVTWRRHPVTVLQKIGPPLLSIALLVLLTVLRLAAQTGVASEATPTLLTVQSFLLLVPLNGWFIIAGVIGVALALWGQYRYADWANDNYSVTKDQIIDQEKKPWFGQLNQRTARIESILNVSYEQANIFSIIFNYGNVNIQTGGEEGELTFRNVAHPLEVQQEIFRRMESGKRKREQAETTRRQREIAEWLRAYADVTHASDPGPPRGGDLSDKEID